MTRLSKSLSIQGNAFPCRYDLTGDLGVATSEAEDSEILISK